MKDSTAKNLVNFLLGFVIMFVLPFAVFMGIYFNLLPQSLLVAIGIFGVIAAAAFIVGGNLFLMYSDIKTGRYKKRS
ncbi:hypothetical protein [Thiomicrospira sp. ALE5]|uniref:hypothetical protein n=1 Tax=Thiomicrospira sp. ALE5 TaxID=748650 RepID=UPI0008EFFEAD|nr:hypothetical protein [Thiomicrospira sp. ALE5]SFR63780.1 hypothetical protein SAMN03092900_1939 [Thiomicrospira sp. ALE5]